MTTNTQKVSAKTKLGYGIGQMGDSIGFNVFYFFFLFFLTDIIGISPSIAGSISLIAVVWDAITDPIIGYSSDNMRSKYGRRRPFMIVSAIPYAIVMFLLFNNVNLSETAKNVYFIVISMMFWTAYTAFVIPYFALGAEITQDFKERTTLRVWASYFMYAAVMIASSAPPMIVAITEKAGGSTMKGWRNVGITFSILTFTAIAICWASTKGKELSVDAIPKAKFRDIFKSYFKIFKMKCVKPLAVSVLLWSCVCSLASGGIVYLINNTLNYDAGTQSLVLMCLSIFAMVWLPVINKLADKFDKKKVYMNSMMVSGIALVVFYFIGFPSLLVLLLMLLIYCYGNSTYWTLYYSMMYDITELGEFKTGERIEGGITALMSFCQKLGAAFAMWLTGQVLTWGQYGVEGAGESANRAIMLVNTAIPGVIGILAALCVIAYPLTKSKFQAISQALMAKKAGKNYSTEGFSELL